MINSPYQKFAPEQVHELGAGELELHAHGGAVALRMSRADYTLAQLFDGSRTAQQRHAAAQALVSTEIRASTLEGFAADLAELRLLQPGRREPLPVSAHDDRERELLGWGTGPAVLVGRGALALPPSTLAGSRGGAGLTGSLTGLISGRRGQANQIDVPLKPDFFVAIGRALIWPITSRWHVALFAAFCVMAVALVYTHRWEWWEMMAGLFGSMRAIVNAVICAVMVNFFSMSARAAAIQRYTPTHPRVGLVFGTLKFPRMFVDTAGAAEHASRSVRLRIVASGLVGSATPAALAVLGWFLLGETHESIARFCVGLSVVGLFSLALRLNPLVRYDGYFLLCHWLDTPDLREQAMGALRGLRDRAWSAHPRHISYNARVLFGIGALLFLAAILVGLLWGVGSWLVERFGGVGFLGLLCVMGIYMVKQYSRVAVDRSSLGELSKPWRPTRRQKIIAAVVALICVLPYPYSASGDFDVLPLDRADVRALVAGDVREVLVKEGDAVAQGQVIARLDDSAQRAKVAATEAEKAQLNAELTIVKKGARIEEIDVARSRVATARAAAEVAEGNARRVATAFRGKSVTPLEYERTKGAAEVARQQLAEAQRALELVESPALAERIESLEADMRRVEAELDYAKQELQYTQISAPIAGRVVSSQLQFARGIYLARGDQLGIIEDTSQLLADIRLPESSIGDIEIDAEASLKPWAFPSKSFDGHVRAIAPAAEESTYGKVIRVQVQIDDSGELKTGMTGNAKVDAGWSLTGIVFTRAIARFLFVELWAWIP